MHLFFRRMGQGAPMIILHGLYGSSDNWLTVARELSEHYELFIPDLRNHGRSPHDPVHTYPAMRDDIFGLMDEIGTDRCIVLGHSMGGKVAVHMAASAPERISKLIVTDIAPINYSSLSNHSPLAVEHLNIADALLHTDLTLYVKREDIDRDWVESIPDIDTRRFLLKNLQRSKNNRYEWRINIRALAQNLPHILNGMDDLGLDKGRRIESVPTLFLKGELSPYIRPEMYPFIRQAFPESRIVTIHGAGHWMHAEQPETFITEVLRFAGE